MLLFRVRREVRLLLSVEQSSADPCILINRLKIVRHLRLLIEGRETLLRLHVEQQAHILGTASLLQSRSLFWEFFHSEPAIHPHLVDDDRNEDRLNHQHDQESDDQRRDLSHDVAQDPG